MRQLEQTQRLRSLLLGVGFTFIFAGIGIGLSQLPVLSSIGALGCAIILAIIYRQVWGYPEAIRSGIQFSSKYILRLAIILFGLKLDLSVLLNYGAGLILGSVAVIVFSIGVMMWLARRLKANMQLTLLLAIGTGVCGAAAIAAVSPIIAAKEEDTAVSVGMIALIGTIFSLLYTIILPILPISMTEYGMWAGLSLHEIAHVVLALEPAGEEALGVGLVAKLSRVLLLIPLSFLLLFWFKRKNKSEQASTKFEFPWFLIGFVVMSVIGTYVIGDRAQLPSFVMPFISNVTTIMLAAAMVGLGLNVQLKNLGAKALRPMFALVITSISLSLGVYWFI